MVCLQRAQRVAAITYTILMMMRSQCTHSVYRVPVCTYNDPTTLRVARGVRIEGSAPPSTPRSVGEADVAAHAEQLIREAMAEKASARDATMAHLVVDAAPTQADAQRQVAAAVGPG